MDDRFHLVQREDRLWNVNDALTGGPVEIRGILLYGLDKDDAEDLRDALIYDDARLLDRLDAIVRRRSNPGRGP